MAKTLQQLLKNVGGGLYEASEEELQTLAQKAGLPAAPVSPLGAALVGAGPAAAKMAGTKAQKTPALRQSQLVPEQQTLQQALRVGTLPTLPAPDEAVAKARALRGLSSLDTRVEELKTKALAAATTAAPVAVLRTPEEAAALPPGLSQALAALQANPQDQAAWVAANAALGRGPGQELTAAQLVAQYGQTAEQAIAKQATSAIAEPTLRDLTPAQLKEMGYGSIGEISNLLGEDASGLTFTQLTEKVNQLIQQELSDTQDLQARLADPNIGAAEKAELRQRLREAGATGQRAAESEARKTREAIREANLVTFAGREMPIEEALGDASVSMFIEDFVTGTPEKRAELAKSEPALAQFVQKNQTLFAEAVAELEKGATKLKETQAQRAGAADLGSGVRVDDSVMKTLVGEEWGRIGEKALDLSSVAPLLTQLKSDSTVPVEDKQVIAGLLRDFVDKPQVLQHLVNLSHKQLKDAGLTTAEGIARFTANLPFAERVSRLRSNEGLLPAIGFPDQKALQSAMNEVLLMTRSGLFPNADQLLSAMNKIGITVDAKGRIQIAPDAWEKVRKTVPVAPGQVGFDVGRLTSFDPSSADLSKRFREFGQQINEIFPIVSEAFVNDGRISKDEVSDIVRGTKSLATVSAILDNPVLQSKMDPEARTQLETLAKSRYVRPQLDEIVKQKGGTTLAGLLTSLRQTPLLDQRGLDYLKQSYGTFQRLNELRQSDEIVSNPILKKAYDEAAQTVQVAWEQYSKRRNDGIAKDLATSFKHGDGKPLGPINKFEERFDLTKKSIKSDNELSGVLSVELLTARTLAGQAAKARAEGDLSRAQVLQGHADEIQRVLLASADKVRERLKAQGRLSTAEGGKVVPGQLAIPTGDYVTTYRHEGTPEQKAEQAAEAAKYAGATDSYVPDFGSVTFRR